MSAKMKIVQKIADIMRDEIGLKLSLRIVHRITKETIPSSNKSYDKTIHMLATELDILKG